MVSASIAFPLDVSRSGRRLPWRERLSAGGAAVFSIVGLMVAIGIAMSALLVVPVAAVIVFG
ncbi:hypothetical protein ACC848_39265, partial [Rhizobium johnstonii]